MNITVLHNGTLVALFRSRWADDIYISYSADNGESWPMPQATELPNNNSSIQVTTLASGELALVYNAMDAADTAKHRASFYDGISDGDDSHKEPTTVGHSALWGAPRALMTITISADGGKSWP